MHDHRAIGGTRAPSCSTGISFGIPHPGTAVPTHLREGPERVAHRRTANPRTDSPTIALSES
jgi:hypothetical protein